MKSKFQLIALAALVMTASACGSKSATEETTTTATEAVGTEKPKVKLANVTVRPVAQIAEYTATVKADVVNKIAPSTPVRIKRILVEVGDRVSKGQKLVEMDDVNSTSLKYDLDNMETEFKRIDELYKVGGVSKSDWDAMRTNLDKLRRSYANMIENTQLVSPINGVVTARNYDNGDLYSGANPVLVVEQISPVKLIVNVSENNFPKVKKGDKVTVKLDVYGDEEFAGVVDLIYPTIDAATRTFPVEVKVANANQRIRPGMFARVIMNFGTADHVVVPDMAVVKQAGSGDRYVYVYNDGKVSYNKVELGRRMDTEYELISGVENNSQVVIAGQKALLNGMEVEVEK
ncbi:MAG: efflux RND transporter periplasmic adaptor subunit [Bacteroidaceae bacterium]|nr:efflux RND transporter periplasmic adaptor subunit [Bacteroidaceae bacterium]